MFNFQGQEVFVIFVLALIVLGPERLPEAMRKLGNFVAEVRKMTGGFQQEFKAVVDEPMRQMRESVDMIRDQTDIRKWPSDSSPGPAVATPAATESPATDAATHAAAGAVTGQEPPSFHPTPHVPTFDTDAAESVSLVGDVDDLAVVQSTNTDLREWVPTNGASVVSQVGQPVPSAPVHESQLLRDFSPTRPVVNSAEVDAVSPSPSAGSHVDS